MPQAQQSPIAMPPQPLFQRSNTWHGIEEGHRPDLEPRGSGYRDRSRDRDSGSRDRERHGDRSRHGGGGGGRDSDYNKHGLSHRNSPNPYSDSYGGSDLQGRRQRVLDKTDRMVKSYHQRGGGSEHDRKRGRY